MNTRRYIQSLLPSLVLACLLLAMGCARQSYPGRRDSLQPDAGVYGVATQDGSSSTSVQGYSHTKNTQAETALQQRINSLLDDPACQTYQVGISIYDITEGRSLYARGQHQRMRPASTEKVVTAITALDILGPDYGLTTHFFADGAIIDGHLKGDLWVVGAMDPLLSRADLRSVCQALRQAGIKSIDGVIRADLGLKDSDRWGWGWCWDDRNPVLTPLLVDGDDAFGQAFLTALRQAGIQCKASAPALSTQLSSSIIQPFPAGRVPASATELCVCTHRLPEVMVAMMKDSHNLSAESVFYQLLAATGTRGGGRKQVAALVNGLIDRAAQQCGSIGVSSDRVQVADGSGLSLYNYQTAETFVTLLRYAALSQRIYPTLFNVLPIAAVDGTLRNRMGGTPAAGRVRAKTGTVEGVSSLVGYVTHPRTGHLIAFAILTQGVQRTALGRNLQDQICTLLCE